MIGSAVPTQNCVRTLSATTITRKISYSTGTMIAAADAEHTGKQSRDHATEDDRTGEQPNLANGCVGDHKSLPTHRLRCENGDPRLATDCTSRFRRDDPVRDQRKRITEDGRVGVRFDRVHGKMATKRARAGHRMKEAEHVTYDRMQPDPATKLALDIRDERLRRSHRRREWRRIPKQLRINGEQAPRFLVGGATHHCAVDMLELL
jgi:hypothetical protein